MITSADERNPQNTDQRQCHSFSPIFHDKTDCPSSSFDISLGKGGPLQAQYIILLQILFQALIFCGIKMLEFECAVTHVIHSLHDGLDSLGKIGKVFHTKIRSNPLKRRREKELYLYLLFQIQKSTDLIVEFLNGRCQLVFQSFGGSDCGYTFYQITVNHHKTHVGPLKFHFVPFHTPDLNRENAVVFCQFLIFPFFFSDVTFIRAHVIEPIVEKAVRMNGIFF